MPDVFVVSEEYDGERLDKYLSLVNEKLSRSFLQKLIKDGEVLVNGRVPKASLKLSENDSICLNVPQTIVPDILPEPIDIDIIYEDDDVILVNKPKGMVVHPGAGHFSGTLVNALMYHCGSSLSGINGIARPGIVHRIDKDTTGIIIACKNDRSHRLIAQQLKDHTVTRRYYAICHGWIR